MEKKREPSLAVDRNLNESNTGKYNRNRMPFFDQAVIMGETNHCTDVIVFDSELFLKSCTWKSSGSLLSALHRCQEKQTLAPLTQRCLGTDKLPELRWSATFQGLEIWIMKGEVGIHSRGSDKQNTVSAAPSTVSSVQGWQSLCPVLSNRAVSPWVSCPS